MQIFLFVISGKCLNGASTSNLILCVGLLSSASHYYERHNSRLGAALGFYYYETFLWWATFKLVWILVNSKSNCLQENLESSNLANVKPPSRQVLKANMLKTVTTVTKFQHFFYRDFFFEFWNNLILFFKVCTKILNTLLPVCTVPQSSSTCQHF